jgi:N-acyl amino acid synthase of PEP-CTERM/exosortase system
MSQTSVVTAKTAKPGPGTIQAAPGRLIARVIDNDPGLLERSYQLRYQVYCLERAFLQPENYPNQRELDEFDGHSIHIGVLNSKNDLFGTVRLVQPSLAGLPLFQHCSLFDDAPSLDAPHIRVIEMSRLAVSREYNSGAAATSAAAAAVSGGFYSGGNAKRGGVASQGRKSGEIVLQIYKAVYQESKRRGFTHWLAATEKSLQRLMIRYGFPWRPVGPEVDYYGFVAPYLMSVREFEHVILSERIPVLNRFLDGLEPEFMPRGVWELVDALR